MSKSVTSNAVAPTLAKALSMARACLVSGGITRQSFKLAALLLSKGLQHVAGEIRLPCPVVSLPGCVSISCHGGGQRSEEHTSELQSLRHLVCRLLLEKKNSNIILRRSLTDFDPTGVTAPSDRSG